MKISYTKNNTHVEDSIKIKTRKAIGEEVDTILFVRDAKMYPTRKSRGSYINEWKGHNRLYKIGYKRDHTKDVDLEEPQKLIWRIIWFIIGGF